jgi:hypothetical protein
MKLAIETTFKKDTTEAGTFSMIIETNDIVNIANTSGPAAANKAIDGFVQKYVEQLKSKLAGVLNK